MDAPVKIVWSQTLPKMTKITTVTVSKDAAGRYFVSLLCDDSVSAKPKVSAKIGIDLGLAHFAIVSTGEKIAAPNTFRVHEPRLAILQRRLDKKQKGSARHTKAKLKVARLHAHISDSRKDFLHKLSTRLVNENQVIAIESLGVSNIVKKPLPCQVNLGCELVRVCQAVRVQSALVWSYADRYRSLVSL